MPLRRSYLRETPSLDLYALAVMGHASHAHPWGCPEEMPEDRLLTRRPVGRPRDAGPGTTTSPEGKDSGPAGCE